MSCTPYPQVNAHFFFSMAWQDCNNYVAKRYMDRDTPRQAYFDDVKMQMVSKRYARMYNALGPPKGVDFLLAFVMEVERGGETLTFAVERAMEEEHAELEKQHAELEMQHMALREEHERMAAAVAPPRARETPIARLCALPCQGRDNG